jgi:lysozyme
LVWTADQCEAALEADVEKFECGLDTAMPWWREQEPLRQDCLLNIAFNIGVHGLMGFTTFLPLMKAGKYPHAALDLRGTAWFHQVGDRAERIAQQILTNVHQN